MGWLFLQGASRRDIIAEVTAERHNDDNGFRIRTLRHCCRGNVLYALYETTRGDGITQKWICVVQMQRGQDDSWGYKDVDESMGPIYFDCPVSYLDDADPPINESAAEWREAVRARAAARALHNAKRPKVGEVWTCRGATCKKVRITEAKGARIVALNLTGGGLFRIPKRLLGERVE